MVFIQNSWGTFIFEDFQNKIVQLEPGTVGIKFRDDGQITSFTEKAQQSLRDAGVDENWKIIKVGSEKFTKKLLIQKARESENYTIEFVYTGDRPDVTK